MSEFPQATAVPPPVAPNPVTPNQTPPAFGSYGPAEQAPTNDPSVIEKASGAAEAGKQGVGDVAQTATDTAKNVAQETTRQARNLVGEARSQLTDQAASQQRGLATNLRSIGTELGTMAERSDQPGLASDLVAQARDRIGEVAGWLEGREPADLLDEVRGFARRRPGTFLAAALVAGIVAGRLTRGVIESHTGDEAPQHAQGARPEYPQGSGQGRGSSTYAQRSADAQGNDYPQMPVSFAPEGVGNGSGRQSYGNEADKLGFGSDPR